MKVLIIRFSSIGDIVLTTPVIRCLKQQHPECEIHYLTKTQFKSVLDGNRYIKELHLLQDNLDAVVDVLKREQFTHIVDLHNNVRTLRVKKALKVPATAYQKLNVQKWLLTNLKLDTMPDVSIVERYLDAAKHLGVVNDGKGLDYFIPEMARTTADDIPMSHWNGYVGCVIGGSYNTKKLPVAKWMQICKELPYPIMLLGGPEDRDAGNEIAELDPVKIYNSCGKFNLNESADLVKRANVIISNDTGLMHIAAAFQKPIVSLWGNTSPEMGMFPYYGFNNLKTRPAQQSVIIENKELSCHPCSKLGYDKCPKGHFRCMNDLPVSKIATETIRLWQQFTVKG